MACASEKCWLNTPTTTTTIIGKVHMIEKLKTALDYLLFNSFVKFGPNVFKQIKGIPMGGNARTHPSHSCDITTVDPVT